MHSTLPAPIETKYGGCRFRSRLEARWAVFFDRLGVDWEYEPEGFELGDFGRYLPDFYLPGELLYIEIKPRRGSIPDMFKAAALSAMAGGKIVVLIGPPQFEFKHQAEVLVSGERLSDDELLVRMSVPFLGKYWHLRTLREAADAATSARFEFGASG